MQPNAEDHIAITQLLARYCLALDVDDDHVRTMQNLLFVERTTGIQRNSVYDDDLLRTPDGWRIARRRCRFIVADGLSDRPAD